MPWFLPGPSAVQNFRVEPLGNGRSTFASVRLSWQEPEETNGIIGYKVQYTRILTQMTVTVTVKPEISPYGNFFTYILSHLHGRNMYLFKMMAFNLKENIDGPSEFETKETYPAGLCLVDIYCIFVLYVYVTCIVCCSSYCSFLCSCYCNIQS